MTTDKFENSKPSESTESFDRSSTNQLSDQLNSDLYKDMSIFDKKSSAALPGLEIAGLGESSTMLALRSSESNSKTHDKAEANAETKAESKNESKSQSKGETPDSRDAKLKQDGMQRAPGEDHGNADVYKPANGQTDKHGRSQVELIHQNGQLQYERSSYPDGRQTMKEYGPNGDVVATTHTGADGKKTTVYPGINGNADTMASAYKHEGAEGLKREIDNVLKQSNGDWSKVDKMLQELKDRGVDIYESAGEIKVNDAWPGFTDSTIGKRPEQAAAAPPPVQDSKAPAQSSDYHPAAPGFVPSWWGGKVTDALKKPAQ